MILAAITLLCGVGLYASLYMLRKSHRAERGGLDGTSVVQYPQARLFFGVPNALFGVVYYPVLAAAVWIDPLRTAPALRWFIIAAVLAAAAISAFLAYALLFRIKRECRYCWSAHIVNWALLVLVVLGVK